MQRPAIRRAEGAAAVGAQAGGEIDRDHPRSAARPRPGGAVPQESEIPHRPMERPPQSSAEERVDDQIGSADGLLHPSIVMPGFHRVAEGAPSLEVRPGVCGQALGVAKQERDGLPAPVGEQPGDDESVAAIVPRPAQHGGPPRGGVELRPLPHDGVDHRGAGALHQLAPACAARFDRLALDGAHLLRRQDFGHARGSAAAAPKGCGPRRHGVGTWRAA